MKSEKLKSILKGIWAFCSYVFVPRDSAELYGAGLMLMILSYDARREVANKI